MEPKEMPLGFTMALAENPEAMKRFGLLGENEKREIIAGTRFVESKEAMRQYVNRIASTTDNTDHNG